MIILTMVITLNPAYPPSRFREYEHRIIKKLKNELIMISEIIALRTVVTLIEENTYKQRQPQTGT